jgi:hypothetical protein
MNSWKIILAAVVIFCAGVITGSLLVNQVPEKRPGDAAPVTTEPNTHPPGDNRQPGSRPEVPLPRWLVERLSKDERLSKEFVRRLDKELHLTLAQSNHIAAIVAEGQERNRVIWTNVAPHMLKVMRDVNQQIRAELTPEQVKQFEVSMKQHPPRRPPSTNGPPKSAAATNVPPVAPANPPPGV